MAEKYPEMARRYFPRFGFDLDAFPQEAPEKLGRYLEILRAENEKINLTAITDPDEIWVKHFCDSAFLLKSVSIPAGSTLLDVGSGAGFPGLVIAILRPDISVTLLDSLQKRIDFLKFTAETLSISNVTCLHGRAEDFAKRSECRETFDFVTARAVAALPVLLEYCLPFLKIGGLFLAMKGTAESPEDAICASEILGGGQPEIFDYSLDDFGKRRIFRFKKRRSTPPAYPRRSDKIKKYPLIQKKGEKND